MYELKKSELYPKTNHSRNLSYLIEFFRSIGVPETEDSFQFPDSVLTPIKSAPLTQDVYTYFIFAWPNEERVVDLSKVVGSHDERNIYNKTWLQNFLYDPPTPEQCQEYLKNRLNIFSGHDLMPCLFAYDDELYLADGHHRFSTLFIHSQVLKSKNEQPSMQVKARLRVIPKNLDFVRRFNEFCLTNHLYYEDEEGILADFEVIDSNPSYPILRYTNTDITITPDSDFDEVLSRIKNIPNKESTPTKEGEKYVP